MKLLKKMLLQDNSPPKMYPKNKFLTIKLIPIMKKIKLLLTATFLIAISSNAQLEKKTWLVGGTGSFNSFTRESTFIYDLNNVSSTSIMQSKIKQFDISAKVGYFFYNKLVSGITFSYDRQIESDGKILAGVFSPRISDDVKFSAGPFVRYYLLNKDKNFNILAETSYQFGIITNTANASGKVDKFTFLIGPEIFFNSSVGMELLVGYKLYNEKFDNERYYSYNDNGILFSIGFQIHLEKK